MSDALLEPGLRVQTGPPWDIPSRSRRGGLPMVDMRQERRAVFYLLLHDGVGEDFPANLLVGLDDKIANALEL